MRISILLLFIGLTVSAAAQTFTWGTPVKHDKLDFTESSVIKRHLLSEDANGVKRLRIEKGTNIRSAKITLETYDVSLELKDTKVVLGEAIDNRQYEDIVISDDRFHVFMILTDMKAKTNTLSVVTFDMDGEQISENKSLDVIKDVKILGPGNFYVAGSKDGKQFASIGLPPYKKKTKETVQVKTYDIDFKETFGGALQLPHFRKRIIYNTPFISNAGEFYMAKRIKVKKVGVVFEMYHLDKGAKKLNATTIDLPENSKPVMIDNKMIEASNGDMILVGEQKEDKRMRAARGVFFIRFDKTGKVVKQMAANLADSPKLGITGFSVKKVELIGDDLYYFADLNGKSIVAGTDPSKREYTYSGGNMYVIKVSDGKIVWANAIERSISQAGGKGSMVDWGWNVDAETGQVVVFYNDWNRLYEEKVKRFRKDIPNLIPIQIVIGDDGKMDKRPLLGVELGKFGDKFGQRKKFGRMEDTYSFCPNEIYQRDGYLLVKCTNSVDFKLGRVKY